MPRERIPMRKIKDVLRLHYEGQLSRTRIGKALGLSKGVVSKYLSLFEAQGLRWPLPDDWDEGVLEQRLFPATLKPAWQVEPDFAAIHQQLKRKGVTLQLLWSEYAATHAERAYRYSRFCDLYRAWAGRQKRSMRQIHQAGEKLFIDYCGPTVGVLDRHTGELRHHTFFDLAELNAAIAKLLVELNERPFQRLPGSRKSTFEALDRPALKPLPDTPYDYAEWKQAKPGIDYHVEVHRHYYSVPHALVGERLDVRTSTTLVEVFHKGKQVASHPRASKGGFTTVAEHMPKAHQKHRQWSPGRFLNWAQDIGPCTLEVVKRQLHDRPHPEHGYRACLGLLNLAKRFSAPRLEVACERALSLGSTSYQSIHSILDKGLDRQPPAEPQQCELPLHANVRGPGYYH
jgi:transposase